jgi:hypothetical protein
MFYNLYDVQSNKEIHDLQPTIEAMDAFLPTLTWSTRGDFVHTRMCVGVFWTVDLFLEIFTRLGRWKDFFLSPPFIRISK